MASETEPLRSSKLQLDILTTVERSQQENGLRHDDYLRYRQFCARRLLRVRRNKAVRLTQRSHRGKYEHVAVTAEACTHALFLLIPLFNAERAWAYAMQLKQDEPTAAQAGHMIRRLGKAWAWAKKLRELCRAVGDDMTVLQSEAYAAWMQGNYALEKDDLRAALPAFSQAKKIYEDLGEVATQEQREIMRKRLDNIDLVILYCSRYLSMEGNDPEEIVAMNVKSAGASGGMIQSKLNKLREQTLKQKAHEGFQVEFSGMQIPVRNTAVGVLVLEAQSNAETLRALVAQLTQPGSEPAQASADVDGRGARSQSNAVENTWEKVDTLFVDTFSKYDDAARAVQKELAALTSQSSQDQFRVEELQKLGKFLKNARLESVMERNVLFGMKLEEQFQTQLPEAKRIVRPQDLLRMVDKILQNVRDRRQITGSTPSIEAQQAHYSAQRSLYVANAYAQQEQWSSSFVVLERAHSLIGEAKALYEKCELSESMMNPLEALQRLEKRIRGGKCLAQAEAFLLQLKKQAAVDGSTQAEFKFGELIAMPPKMEAVTPRPIILDAAMNYLETPRFSAAAEQQKQTEQGKSWLGRAFGFGGK